MHSIILEIDELGRSVATMRTVTQTFSRFVPRRLVERLIETGTPLQLGGTRREVTLLFSDVVNFTKITEKADPARVMQYTSRYFAAMSHEIMAHSGTVDKFIGDAIMATGTRRPTIPITRPMPALPRSPSSAPTVT